MNAFTRDDVIRAVPYARRYGRALAGNQKDGDALVAQALQGLSSRAQPDARLALYAGIGAALGEAAADDEALSLRDRQLLLLTALEELTSAEAGDVLGIGADAAETAVAEARARLREAAATDVLVIEDEPIIAMDIAQLVRDCGHRVAGLAASEAEAVRLAQQTQPGLILADINLGSGGDGMSAVARILEVHQAPVVFVTAYPERLLTGERVEPTFVVTKPFDPLALAITTYQATQPRKLAR